MNKNSQIVLKCRVKKWKTFLYLPHRHHALNQVNMKWKKNSWISIVCNDYGEEKETKRQMVQGRDKKKMCRFARCFFCLYLSSTMLRHVLSNFNVTHLSITIYFMCTCLFDRHRHCIVYTRHVDYEKSLSEKWRV